jgi:hypothetical protein
MPGKEKTVRERLSEDSVAKDGGEMGGGGGSRRKEIPLSVLARCWLDTISQCRHGAGSAGLLLS